MKNSINIFLTQDSQINNNSINNNHKSPQPPVKTFQFISHIHQFINILQTKPKTIINCALNNLKISHQVYHSIVVNQSAIHNITNLQIQLIYSQLRTILKQTHKIQKNIKYLHFANYNPNKSHISSHAFNISYDNMIEFPINSQDNFKNTHFTFLHKDSKINNSKITQNNPRNTCQPFLFQQYQNNLQQISNQEKQLLQNNLIKNQLVYRKALQRQIKSRKIFHIATKSFDNIKKHNKNFSKSNQKNIKTSLKKQQEKSQHQKKMMKLKYFNQKAQQIHNKFKQNQKLKIQIAHKKQQQIIKEDQQFTQKRLVKTQQVSRRKYLLNKQSNHKKYQIFSIDQVSNKQSKKFYSIQIIKKPQASHFKYLQSSLVSRTSKTNRNTSKKISQNNIPFSICSERDQRVSVAKIQKQRNSKKLNIYLLNTIQKSPINRTKDNSLEKNQTCLDQQILKAQKIKKRHEQDQFQKSIKTFIQKQQKIRIVKENKRKILSQKTKKIRNQSTKFCISSITESKQFDGYSQQKNIKSNGSMLLSTFMSINGNNFQKLSQYEQKLRQVQDQKNIKKQQQIKEKIQRVQNFNRLQQQRRNKHYYEQWLRRENTYNQQNQQIQNRKMRRTYNKFFSPKSQTFDIKQKQIKKKQKNNQKRNQLNKKLDRLRYLSDKDLQKHFQILNS